MNTKKFRIPAAILLLIYLVITLFRDMEYYIEYLQYKSVRYLAVLFFIEFAVDILLCVALFSGNRGNLIVLAVGFETLVRILHLVSSFTFLNVLSLCAYVLLLVITILLTEQTIIQADVSKIKVKPVAILPALFLLCISVYLSVRPFDFASLAVFDWWKIRNLFAPLIFYVLRPAVLLLFSFWLKNSDLKKPANNNSDMGLKEKQLNYFDWKQWED